MKTEYDWTRINNDANGNPRYVIHFLSCVPESWKHYDLIDNHKYEQTVKLMNRIGGKKYHNKKYGGGIVFQSYCLEETEQAIDKLKIEITAKDEYQGWTNSATWSAAYLTNQESDIYENLVKIYKANKEKYANFPEITQFVSGYDVKKEFERKHLQIDHWCKGVINWQEIADAHYNNNEY